MPSAKTAPRMCPRSIRYVKEEKWSSSPANSRELYSSKVRGSGISYGWSMGISGLDGNPTYSGLVIDLLAR